MHFLGKTSPLCKNFNDNIPKIIYILQNPCKHAVDLMTYTDSQSQKIVKNHTVQHKYTDHSHKWVPIYLKSSVEIIETHFWILQLKI